MLLLFTLALSVSYAFIGGAIKFLDNIHDQNRQFKGRLVICWLLVLCVVILVNFWVLIDIFSAVLALALIIGLLVTRKIDNAFFASIVLVTLPVTLYSVLLFGSVFLVITPIVAFTPAVVVDELLQTLDSDSSKKIPGWLLARRPILKIVVLVLAFFGLYPLSHAIAFWSFDIVYDIIAYLLRASVKTG